MLSVSYRVRSRLTGQDLQASSRLRFRVQCSLLVVLLVSLCVFTLVARFRLVCVCVVVIPFASSVQPLPPSPLSPRVGMEHRLYVI